MGGCQGRKGMGAARAIQHLPGQLPLPSWREAGLLGAGYLSLFLALWPDPCSGER